MDKEQHNKIRNLISKVINHNNIQDLRKESNKYTKKQLISEIKEFSTIQETTNIIKVLNTFQLTENQQVFELEEDLFNFNNTELLFINKVINELNKELFNQDYTHLSLKELQQDLNRMEESHKQGKDYFSNEKFNVEQEIKTRKKYLKQILKVKKWKEQIV